jgi:glycosyltransferase involved in cell wall biosynthesis
MSRNYPVAIFCYNRPRHLERTIASLRRNVGASATSLFIFSDGPRDGKDYEGVMAVRQIIEKVTGFGEVIVRNKQENSGLAASIIEGVSEMLKDHEACIVLEDDLETSPWFLNFMNEGLSRHQYQEDVFSISGYCPPIAIPPEFHFEAFRFYRINSWGWGTWADRWQEVDWNVKGFDGFIQNRELVKSLEKEGKDLPVMLLKQHTGQIGSWAVRFNQACFEKGKTNIYPVVSLVRNTGADGTGTHMRSSGKYAVELSPKKLSPFPTGADETIDRAFRKFYKPSLFRQVINRIKIVRYICKLK